MLVTRKGKNEKCFMVLIMKVNLQREVSVKLMKVTDNDARDTRTLQEKAVI